MADRASGLPLLLRQALPGLVVLFAVLRAARPVSDPDTFWHLAAGDHLRETWSFSGTDPFSTMSTQPWRLHEWLPELVMSLTQQTFGLAGVSWLLPVGVAAIALCLWLVLRREAPLLVTTLVLVVALVAMSGSLSLRPHLVSFACATVTTGAWLAMRRDGRPRWWLVPLTWAWACSHGMWFVGVAVGVVAVVGLVLDGAARGRSAMRLALIPLASLVAAALTPVGPQLLAAPFAVREYAQFVAEWRSPALTDVPFVAFLVCAAVTLLVWSRERRTTPWTEILLMGLAVGFALLYVRTIAVGAAVVAPLAALTVARVARLPREPVARREVALTLGLAAAALAVAGLLAPSRGAQPGFGPDDLDRQIAALPAGTVLCNDYGIGGWLIWRHPNVRPAIDGRTEVYAVSYVDAYLTFQDAAPGWQSYLGRTGCRWALLPTDLPVSDALVRQSRWTVTARDSSYLLLRAPAAAG
ncbi:hypothetical protein [Terrabacter aerolatus]|uniref:hypothetical protein n=1 Tax=Terrabacter aerolatus TaxID=422442 RepID=UPI0011BD5639|nr:hypothetical protein [Terrabacter aerolatus]